MTHRTFDEQISNFNRVVSSWDINQEYKVALLGMIASLGYEHEKSITPELRWIPVTERLPKEDGNYLVSGKWGSGKESVGDCEFSVEDGYFQTAWNFDVLAWREFPEPYKEVTT